MLNNVNSRGLSKSKMVTIINLPGTKIVFSSIIFRKDRRDIEKQRNDNNTRLKNFCKQKNISFADNSNLKEEHLGLKKSHLNRIGNSILAKNFLSYFENN